MSTPYVTAQMLINAPTGVSWSTIPSPTADAEEKLKEQTNLCWRATHGVEGICNQPLRATIDQEQWIGPGLRLTVYKNGMTRALASRWPILRVVSGRWSPSTQIPPHWTDIAADQFMVEESLSGLQGSTVMGAGGVGGTAINLAPGHVWGGSRMSTRLQISYINGWPHCGFITSLSAGVTAIAVDDVTGFAGADSPGVLATIYDGQHTETVLVTGATGTVTSGPGTLTLGTATVFKHEADADAPLILSALPADIQWATIMLAVDQALVRGATATTVQAVPGSSTRSGQGPGKSGSSWYRTQAETILHPYKRVLW